jgi:hypothetical protein
MAIKYGGSKVNKNTIIFVISAVAIIVVGGYLYDQNRKIDDLQQALVSQQNIQKLNSTENGYNEASSNRKHENSQQTAKKAKSELANRKKGYRDNWADFVSFKDTEYLTREIGGIFDLKVTVVNKFDAPIDKLIATISYLNANGDIFKTEDIEFNNVPANSIVTLPAPDSNRGTKVKVSFVSISVKAYDFCFPGNNRIETDPYLCEL